MRSPFWLTTVSALIFLGVSSSATRASAAKVQMLCVDPAKVSCQPTIQDAVNLAVKNTVITVAAGTYSENVSINPQIGPKAKKLTLTLTGAGIGSTIVDGGGVASVFTVGPMTTLTLSDMTIRNGNAGTGGGGGVSSVNATNTLKNSLVTNNAANQGGGIFIDGGALTVTSSTISGNTTSGTIEQGGGIFFDTGSKAGKLSITNSTISGNTATQGAGLFAANPIATVAESTISGNTAPPLASGHGGFGGGVLVESGALTILNSTISGNVAEAGGVSESIGGGLEIADSKVTVNNVTIADNTASTAGGVDEGAGGFFKTSNSIIANNTATTAVFNDCAGPLVSIGFNLILDTNGCTIIGKTSSDITGQDPLLKPLANNGGSTETQALGLGSPALTKGNPAKPNKTGAKGKCLATDQIGDSRAKGLCDIGARQQSGLI